MNLSRALFLCFVFLAPFSLAQEDDPQTKPDSQEASTEQPATPSDDPFLNSPIRSSEDLAAEAERQGPRDFDSGSAFLSVMSSLLIVLGVIVLLAWLARKYLPKQLGMGATGTHLKLIQSLPLGGNQRFVSIIEADGRRFLIGVTEHQINLIRDLEALDFEGALSTTQPRSIRELMEDGE